MEHYKTGKILFPPTKYRLDWEKFYMMCAGTEKARDLTFR